MYSYTSIFPCRNHMGHCPGETGSLLWLSFSLRSGPETGFVAICIGFRTKNCDVLPHIMHKVTFTSPLTFHIFFEMYIIDVSYKTSKAPRGGGKLNGFHNLTASLRSAEGASLRSAGARFARLGLASLSPGARFARLGCSYATSRTGTSYSK